MPQILLGDSPDDDAAPCSKVPAFRISKAFAQRAEPKVVTSSACRERQTDPTIAAAAPAIPAPPAIIPPVLKMRGAYASYAYHH